MTPDPTPEESRRYTIHEIASLAGLSTRTVRYYIAEALVDRPHGTKRGAERKLRRSAGCYRFPNRIHLVSR